VSRPSGDAAGALECAKTEETDPDHATRPPDPARVPDPVPVADRRGL